MKFIRTDIPDVVIIEPQLFGDERGYFIETFRDDKLEEFLGFNINFIQGAILDVAVDIRKESPTFGNTLVSNFRVKIKNYPKKTATKCNWNKLKNLILE